jgi:hypothetical protein
VPATARRPAVESPWKREEVTAAGEGAEELESVGADDVEEIEPELEDLADDEEEVDLPAEPGIPADEEEDSEW